VHVASRSAPILRWFLRRNFRHWLGAGFARDSCESILDWYVFPVPVLLPHAAGYFLSRYTTTGSIMLTYPLNQSSLRSTPLRRNPNQLRSILQRHRHRRRTGARLLRILHHDKRRRRSPAARAMGLPSHRHFRLLSRGRILRLEYPRGHG
jgi:hypothetical protein